MNIIAEFRRSALISGRPALTLLRALTWGCHLVLRWPANIVLPHFGIRFFLKPRLRHFGSTSIYMKRERYEPELMFVTGLLNPGDHVIDVGANYGIYTLFMSHRIGAAGKCHAFEPGQEAGTILERNLAQNESGNIRLNRLALSDQPGTARLYHIEASPMNFSMGGGDGTAYEDVAVTTLDLYMRDMGLERVDFIKADVEGYESKVLDGAEELIRQFAPVIMFEVSFPAMDRAALAYDAPFETLARQGYRFFILDPEEGLKEFSDPREGNIFAIPVGKVGGFVLNADRAGDE